MDRPTASYEQDFYAWTQEQAAALRAEAALRSNAPVDWENLAEEVESMGRSERDKIESRLEVLLVHLLKWLYCPELRERCQRGWRNTIAEQRRRIARVIKKNPSLQRSPGEIIEDIYADARALAAGEADVPLKTFPKAPPFTLEQALDPRYPDDLFPAEEDDD
jgi:hypothetical protein